MSEELYFVLNLLLTHKNKIWENGLIVQMVLNVYI